MTAQFYKLGERIIVGDGCVLPHIQWVIPSSDFNTRYGPDSRFSICLCILQAEIILYNSSAH